MKKEHTLLRHNDYLFSVIARLLSFGFSILYSIVYSRYLQPDLRGRVSIIQNYASLLMLFFCLGINQGYPYFRKQNKNAAYTEYVNMVVAFFLLYLTSAGIIVILIKPGIDWCVVLILVPLLFIIKELNYVVLIERPYERNKMSIILSVFDIVFVLFFYCFIKANLFTILLFIILKEIGYSLVAIMQTNINLKSLKPTFIHAAKYIKFGFFPMLTVIMMELNYKADVLMLDAFQISKTNIGIYTLAVSLAEKIWLIPDAMKDILVSQLAKGKNEEEVCKVTRISICIVICLSIIFLCIGKPVIEFMYGKSYQGTFSVIALLLIGIIGMVFYKTVYSYNVTKGKRVINFILLSIATSTNIIANYFLIPKYSIYGAAVASSLSYLICGVVFLLYFCNKTKKPVNDLILLKQDDFKGLKLHLNK